MASRLNFSTGAIVNPLEGLQQAVTSVGGVFDKYVQREQDREDRLTREAEDRRRYETQLGRYDRQEQESLRRYEEGKELNKLEREEARNRWDAGYKLQLDAAERARKDQEYQDADRARLGKERAQAEAFATGGLDLVSKAKQDADALARGQVSDRYMYEAKKEAAAKGKALTSGGFQPVRMEVLDSNGNRIDSEATWNDATGNYEKDGVPVTARLPEIKADQSLQGLSYIPLDKEQAFRTGLEAAGGRVGQADVLKDPSFKQGIVQELKSRGITPTTERVNAIAAEAVGSRLSDAQITEREKEYFNQQARVAGLSSGKEESTDVNGNTVVTGGSRTGSIKPKSVGEQRAALGNDMLSTVKSVFGQTSDDNTFVDSNGTNMVQSMKDVVKFASDPKENVDPLVAKAAFQEMVTNAFIEDKPKGSMSTRERLTEFKRTYDKVQKEVVSGERTLGESDRDVELDKLKSAMVTRYGSSNDMVRKLLQETAAPVAGSQEAAQATDRNNTANSANTRLPVTEATAGISPTQLQLAPKDAVSVLQQVKSTPELDAMNSALADAGVAPSRRLVLLKQAVDSDDYSRVHQALSGKLTPQEQAHKNLRPVTGYLYKLNDDINRLPGQANQLWDYTRDSLLDAMPSTGNLNDMVRSGNKWAAQ